MATKNNLMLSESDTMLNFKGHTSAFKKLNVSELHILSELVGWSKNQATN